MIVFHFTSLPSSGNDVEDILNEFSISTAFPKVNIGLCDPGRVSNRKHVEQGYVLCNSLPAQTQYRKVAQQVALCQQKQQQ